MTAPEKREIKRSPDLIHDLQPHHKTHFLLEPLDKDQVTNFAKPNAENYIVSYLRTSEQYIASNSSACYARVGDSRKKTSN